MVKKLDNSLNPYNSSIEKMPDIVAKTPDTKLPLSFKMQNEMKHLIS